MHFTCSYTCTCRVFFHCGVVYFFHHCLSSIFSVQSITRTSHANNRNRSLNASRKHCRTRARLIRHSLAGVSDVLWRHVPLDVIWCCRWCTWSVVYFFQEHWKCCWRGGGEGARWNCETAFLDRVRLLSIWKENRRPTLTPGKSRAEFSYFPVLNGSLNSARLHQYVLFCLRARASLVFCSLFSPQASQVQVQAFKCRQQSCKAWM